MLIILGALLIGGIIGSLIDIEARLEQFGDWLRLRLSRKPAGAGLTEAAESAETAAITAAGGLLLLGVALRLLQIKLVPVGNLLPALLVAPLLVQLLVILR